MWHRMPTDRRGRRGTRRALPPSSHAAVGASGAGGRHRLGVARGARTEKWRFPVRNRLLAAISDVVVVIESRHHGGSRHTVDAAVARGIPVGAVPGSIRSATSEGTNALLADGAFPVCSTGDVLVALSLAGVWLPRLADPEHEVADRSRPEPVTDEGRLVYRALSSDPTCLDDLARATGLELPTLCGALERLAQAGLARDVGGWWELA